MSGSTIASYLPQRLIIKLSPNIQIVDRSGRPIAFPTAKSLGFFVHEYLHYLHNISTACGIAGFMNTLELWRLFRLSVAPGGFSFGSPRLDNRDQVHLRRLLDTLAAGMRDHRPSLGQIVTPASIAIRSCKLDTEAMDEQRPAVSKLACGAEIRDSGGNAEQVTVGVGTLEIMESAAWLLERRLVRALDPSANVDDAPVFPYQLASALAEHVVPGVAEEIVLTCVLAALQSSDPADALLQVLNIAQKAVQADSDPFVEVRQAAARVVADNDVELQRHLSQIEREFSGPGLWPWLFARSSLTPALLSHEEGLIHFLSLT